MYKTFIIAALVRDVLLVFIFPLCGILIYIGAGLYKQEYRGCALLVLFLFFGGMTALEIWNEFPYLYDYFRYLRDQDHYVQEATCRITDVSSGTASGVLTAMERIHCQDGTQFVSKYRRDYQRVLWRWAREGRTLHVRYLPRSRLVLELMPEESP